MTLRDRHSRDRWRDGPRHVDLCQARAQDLPAASRTGDHVPVTHAERTHVLTVTSTRTPAELAVLTARATRSADLTRLLALRKRRGR